MNKAFVSTYFALAVLTGTSHWSDLCLSVRDVPAHFVLTRSRVVTNPELAKQIKTPESTIAVRFHRIGGYTTEFVRGSRSGAFFIRDIVSDFRGVGDARAFNKFAVSAARVGLEHGARNTQLAGIRVGEQSFAFSAKFSSKGKWYRDYHVFFTQGRFAAVVQVEGYLAGSSATLPVQLARVIDGRLRARS